MHKLNIISVKFCRTSAWVLGLSLLLASAARAQYGLYERPADLTGVGTGWTPRSQFLLRPNTGMEYENFGWIRYRERGGGFGWLPAYDQLGEPWLAGATSVVSWVEDRTRDPDFSSRFYKGGVLSSRHNSIVVAKESFNNGALRLSVSDAMRTTFTSLTLDLSRFSGVRADAILGRNHELVVLATRSSDPRQMTRLARYLGTEWVAEGTMLGAGHWEGRFLQGALYIGGTFVNHHRFDSLQESENFLGTMPVSMNPDTLVVRIADDSPAGGLQGAAVYDGSMSLTLRRSAGENRVVQGIQPVVMASDGARWVEDHWAVEGQEYVEHLVPVPSGAVGARYSSTVGQDYRIGMRQVHRAVNRSTVAEEIRRTPLVIRSRSAGDGPGRAHEVEFDLGLSSAMNIAGLNGKIALGGLNLEWEYARSTAHFQFPEEQIGNRSSYSGAAYFVRGVRDWWRLNLGGEYFSISPKYSSYAFDSGNYRLGDPVIPGRDDYIVADYSGNNFGFYFNESQTNTFSSGNDKRNMIFPLVEDNDDDDQYMDQGQSDEPVTVRTQPLESGVYPGWDLDKDGVPDYNRNRNNLPDYLEPFFKYWQEEQVFYWGDDFNHNGVLDYFEDDSLPDYPYYKDERGAHFFVDLRAPLRGLSFRIGRIRIDQIAGFGQNHADYVSGAYRRVLSGRAQIQWEHELKRVEDDIPNHTFQYLLIEEKADVEGIYQSAFIEDRLRMRNSVVNRGYLGTRWTPVRGLHLHNNFRYELNHVKEDEFADGTTQDADDFNTWALVNKADYTWNWKRLMLRPMFKHTLLKQDMREGTGPGGLAQRRDITELVPIFLANFGFTDRTSIEIGAEGFPFFKERFIDREDEQRDFSSQTYLAQLKMKGRSSGFKVFIMTGLQYTRKEFDEPDLPSGSFVRSFFQVFIGEEILAGSQ